MSLTLNSKFILLDKNLTIKSTGDGYCSIQDMDSNKFWSILEYDNGQNMK